MAPAYLFVCVAALLALHMALSAAVVEATLEGEPENVIDWDSPSFVLTAEQTVTSKSQFKGIDSSIGEVPEDVSKNVQNMLDKQYDATFPITFTVGTVDGEKVGLLNITMTDISPEMKMTMNEMSKEYMTASTSGDEISLHEAHGDPVWVGYQILCPDSATEGIEGIEIVAVTNTGQNDCQTYPKEFVSSVLPTFDFFASLVCGTETSLDDWKQECQEWTEDSGVSTGIDCTNGAHSVLKEGKTQNVEVDDMDIKIEDSAVSTIVKVDMGENKWIPNSLDSESSATRTTVMTSPLPSDAVMSLTTMSHKVHESLMEFKSIQAVSPEVSSKAVQVC